MAKPDPNDHWRRLAAELGLEIEQPSEPAMPTERTESAAATPAEPVAIPSPAPAEAIVTVSRVVERETIEVTWPSSDVPPPLPVMVDQPAEPTEPAEVEAPGADESSGEDGPRRRRRRPRRRKNEAPAATESAPAEADDDDSPADVVKDWDIPSWNELIASLYRPDR